MKIVKKNLYVLFCIIVILNLFACKVNTNFASEDSVEMEDAVYEAPIFTETIAETGAARSIMSSKVQANGINMDTDVDSQKKIIRTIDINAETKNFNDTIIYIKTETEKYNGIMDSSYVDTGNIQNKNYRKNANFTIRIPSENADTFLQDVGNNMNIVFEMENRRDVTDSYNDIEDRLKTLMIEQDKLNELLKKSKTVDEMIKVEEKLMNVRSEIANIDRRLKNLDSKINYTTFNINITEVAVLTDAPITREKITKELLINGFKKNLMETKEFFVNLFVNIFIHLPAILTVFCFALLIVIVVCICRHTKKNVKENKKSIKK